jgi:putative tryptophan/tyrosine transport system substrate-binding protein
MQRRQFIGLIGGAAAWPFAAEAPPERMRHIGVLTVFSKDDPIHLAYMAALREGLQKLGWLEERNIRLEYGCAATDAEPVQRGARELIALRPELIVTGNTVTTASNSCPAWAAVIAGVGRVVRGQTRVQRRTMHRTRRVV